MELFSGARVHEILFGSMHPSIPTKGGDDYWEPLAREEKPVPMEYTPMYDIRFPYPPLSAKVNYYIKVIKNRTVECLNSYIESLADHNVDKILAHRMFIHQDTNKTLKYLYRQITEGDFLLPKLKEPGMNYHQDLAFFETIYLYYYMVAASIYVYMEFQAQFSTSIPTENTYPIEYFYVTTLGIPVPDEIHVISVASDNPGGAGIDDLTLLPGKKTKTGSEIPQSFTLVNIQKNAANLQYAYYSLKETNSFIDKSTSLADFKKVFLGGEITNRIKWAGTFEELTYFIKQITDVHKCVEPTKKKHWAITVNCFVDKDGNEFDRAKFSRQHPPTPEAMAKLSKAAKTLML